MMIENRYVVMARTQVEGRSVVAGGVRFFDTHAEAVANAESRLDRRTSYNPMIVFRAITAVTIQPRDVEVLSIDVNGEFCDE